MVTKESAKKLIAFLCIVLICVVQVIFVMPEYVSSATAGQELEVRVQYEGEPGGKIRTKTVLSNSDLESLGAYDTKYVNITRVGTLMSTAAHVVEIDNIISGAGIDLGSVKSFTFRTTDGYTMTFSGSSYLGATGWYYPNLSKNSYRVESDDGDGAIQMKPGALDGGQKSSAPALAIKSYAVKGFNKNPSYSSMGTATSYRFMTGQTDLSYLKYTDEDGNEAYNPSKEGDITAWDSVKYIYGIDIVLKGSPSINGISLGVDSENVEVGSSKQITVAFDGAFAELDATDVTWSSSDESIATVDSNGQVTILKEAPVTITASGFGHSASVTLNPDKSAEPDEYTSPDTNSGTDNNDQKATAKAKANNKNGNKGTDKNKNKKKDQVKKVIVARELSLGDEILPEEPEGDSQKPQLVNASQTLGEVEQYDPKVVGGSAAAAAVACLGGAVFRVRRYHLDIGKTIKKK